MKNIILSLFLLNTSCLYFIPTYTTSHGLNVYCDETVCFPKVEVEAATDVVISQLISNAPQDFSQDEIDTILQAQHGWHDIVFRKEKVGPPGSCATESDPLRSCRGFECTSSPSGWCAGLTKTLIIGGYDTVSMHVIRNSGCIVGSALVHELIHFFHRVVLKISDGSHSISPYWPTACIEEDYPTQEEVNTCKGDSVDRSANWELCKITCEALCNE